MKHAARNYLVGAPDRPRSVVVAQSLFMELKKRDPACRIEVLADPGVAPLLEIMPEVARSLLLPEHLRLRDQMNFVNEIRSFDYDRAIILKPGWGFAIFPFLAGIAVRSGYSPGVILNDVRLADPCWTTVQRTVALGLETGAKFPDSFASPSLDNRFQDQERVLQRHGIATGSDPVLVLCPDVGGRPTLGWATEHYQRLAGQAARRSWQVVLLAETSDAGFGETICGRASGCHNLVGQLSLAEAIDLLSVADLVIGDQSEFMYLALALGRQVLMLASPDHLDGVCDLFPEGRFLPLETDPADIVSVLEDS